MRLLVRNRTEFEYYAYIGVDSGIDEETGMNTGVFHPLYADPVSYKGNISSPSGAAVQAFDGLDIRYTHVLLMDDPNADISEMGRIRWKGRMYRITAVRPSMNVLSVALLAETVNYGDQYHETDGGN